MPCNDLRGDLTTSQQKSRVYAFSYLLSVAISDTTYGHASREWAVLIRSVVCCVAIIVIANCPTPADIPIRLGIAGIPSLRVERRNDGARLLPVVRQTLPTRAHGNFESLSRGKSGNRHVLSPHDKNLELLGRHLPAMLRRQPRDREQNPSITQLNVQSGLRPKNPAKSSSSISWPLEGQNHCRQTVWL